MRSPRTERPSRDHYIRTYTVDGTTSGHMGAATYYMGDDRSKSLICTCSEIGHAASVGDEIEVTYHYDRYGGPWRIKHNGRVVMERTAEDVRHEREATAAWVNKRIKEIQGK